MIKNLLYLLFVGFAILISSQAFSQKKDSTWIGSFNGIVWDSAHNFVLRTATVAVYGEDSELIAYSLTNNYGEFTFKVLPTDIPLKMVASFIGYKSSAIKFLIPSLKKEIDIGLVNLTVASDKLEEVTVRAVMPPVRMKGDTLEFNADAFKLDPNAQTEDLLRILPGITIWADGAITVNGREVKSILVNGKPFFGGDARVATQNIPKNIVDKVQVYQKDRNPGKSADSTTEINIKLKKGKEVGTFGKFSGGVGTGNHYESDGNLNFFNGRSQLGVAVSCNNVNKIANDINFILRNNTFKGTGANVEYQSNFSIEGVNKYTAGGLIVQHDFQPNPDYNHRNRLTAIYFIKNNKQDLDQNTQTTTTISNSDFNTQRNRNNSINTQQSQNATATYERFLNGNRFSIDGRFKEEITNSASKNELGIYDRNNDLISVNNIYNNSASTLSDIRLTTVFKHKPINQDRSWLSRYEVIHKLNFADFKNDQTLQSTYIVPADAGANKDFDRLYDNDSKNLSQNLIVKLPNFGAVILGDHKPSGIITGLQSEIGLITSNDHNNVSDRDTVIMGYRYNPYLTNKRSEVATDIKPALTFTKNESRSLSNRYEKNFSALLSIGPQFYSLNSNSEKTFQAFSNSYLKFVPKADISYSNRQFGEFTNSFLLQIAAFSQYPTVQQLVPLVDSTNLNFIQAGNADLKEQDTRELTFTFTHLSEKSKNIFSWSLTLNAGYINNYFTSSSTIDILGRSVYITVNADGYRYTSSTADLKKAFKIRNSQLQFSVSPTLSVDRSPTYINGLFYYFHNLSLWYNPGLSYTYKDRLAITVAKKQNYSHSRQKGDNTIELKNLVNQSELSFSINCTKKLSLSSNIIYTKNKYNGAFMKAFTIWNASADYKLFKGNIAEIKFSALDLLHQNTGLINYGSNNSITQGTTNVLQQYFMLTLAYFPRKFGK